MGRETQTTVADLFSGLGGTSTGATLAGARVLWCANHWRDAITWHGRNHPGVEHYCQDLAELDWSAVQAPDVLMASPACQGFSTAGQPARRGAGGSHAPSADAVRRKSRRDRNTAYAVLAAADTLRPRVVVVENVVKLQAWPAFGPWCDFLRALGYAVEVHTLNGMHFGGYQDRPRTIVTASLGGPLRLPDGDGSRPGAIADCLDSDDHAGNRWRPVASLSERMQSLIRKAKREAGSRCFWNNVSESRGRPLSDPFPTSTTQSGTQWNLIDGDRCRVLNPRELARSMRFPESYEVPQRRTLASKLIGNAMDVGLARMIAEVAA